MDILCDGALLVPPERGTIIGRAVWKPRYVVLGHQNPLGALLPRSSSSHRLGAGRKAVKGLSLKPSRENMVPAPSDQLWLSIYKAKDDLELLSQHAISLIRSCEIQSLQYRKPGPTISTLVIAYDPDPTAEKARKRRSSRAGGLSSSSHSNTLLFRTIPEERYNIYDWQMVIRPRIRPKVNTYEEPLSPDSSTTFSSFMNPFSPRNETFDRGPMSPKPDLQRVGSDHTFASAQTGPIRDRDPTSSLVSPSPSLRSKSSNVSSSQASSFGRPPGYRDMLPIQQMPADLPSPTSMSGFDDQSILGWTSAQGRSSALSSHTRGSNSVSTAGTSPVPRETILDRAFMMRCIPGSDRVGTAEGDGEKLSSTARFEALMREAEERLKKKVVSHPDQSGGNRVASWNLDEEEDEDDDESMEGDERRATRDDDGEGFEVEPEMDPTASTFQQIPTPAQRALEYISGRSTPMAPMHKKSSQRPTSPPTRSQAPPRSKTTPPRVHQKKKERPKSMAFSSTSTSTEKEHDHYSSTKTHQRQSSNSTRRLSFTDFTKHLSSTSSLLLVQTNASNGSMGGDQSSRNSRQSSEVSMVDDPDENLSGHRGLSQSRLSGMGAPSTSIRGGGGSGGVGMEMDSKRCGWRGSGLGVFGGEGGFL